jgi:hypothetical protein
MSMRSGLVLDAGAFIVLERRHPVMVALVQEAALAGLALVTSAGVIAQVWRAPPR